VFECEFVCFWEGEEGGLSVCACFSYHRNFLHVLGMDSRELAVKVLSCQIQLNGRVLCLGSSRSGILRSVD
jgi:hypothetical protein